MTYQRVIPRDLFNEGKLLTSLGFLTLAIHDNTDGIAKYLSVGDDQKDSFDVELSNSGFLYVSNLEFWDRSGDKVYFFTAYNTRTKHPLMFETDSSDGFVFDDDGFTQEFLNALGVSD